MKKILLFVAAVVFVSVSALAQQSAQHGSGTNGLWLCQDPGAPRVQCDVNNTPTTSMKCCWKNDPLAPKGNVEGGKGGKNGESETVCEKFNWPEIIHRPRCFESQHCKNFPKLRCEDLIGNETHGKLAPCCWEGEPQPVGGRGGKGGKGGKGGATSNKTVKPHKVAPAAKGAITSQKAQPVK